MKYALVDNKKMEATKGTKGICPSCGSELIAKCGEVKVHHWSHKGKRNCDPWWENETQWHRSWKRHFPDEWQEVVHFSDDGEKHIADVKTGQDWVLEFQHSFLKPEERRSRDGFYDKLVWVVDGMRRKLDRKQFLKILNESVIIHKSPLILKPHFPDESRLLREWMGSSSLVFFDFTELDSLWFLIPEISDIDVYLMQMNRIDFIEYQKDNRFEKLYTEGIQQIRNQLKKRNRKRRVRVNTRNVLSNSQLRRMNRRF